MKIHKIPARIGKIYRLYREFYHNKEILKNNRDLANIKACKTCFIIGNGPSIKNQDLVSLADKDTFVMNSFWRHPQYKLINPKYYLAASFPYLSSGGSRSRYVQDEDLPGSNPIISQVPETKLIFSMIAKEIIEKNNVL